MTNFLPEKYDIPEKVSGYMKFKPGDNTFRSLSSAITGYEYWNTENKPVRSVEFPANADNLRVKDGKTSDIKHFWAFVVWNYDLKAVQILQITQVSIQKAIKKYVDNKKWGDPKGYDITVTKSGDGLETEYATVAEPHSAVTKEIADAHASKSINLSALYEGNDPFAVEPGKTEHSPYPKEQINPEDIPF